MLYNVILPILAVLVVGGLIVLWSIKNPAKNDSDW